MCGKFYGKLKALRVEKGMSQTELARRVKSSPSYISKLENDPFIQVSHAMLQRLANALEVSVEEVWESPYDELVGDPSTGPVSAERAVLRAFRKLERKSQNRLLKTLNHLKELDERDDEREKTPPDE